MRAKFVLTGTKAMSKKKNKNTDKKEKLIDINQTIINNNIEPVTPDNVDDEDEFEQLLNSFINSDSSEDVSFNQENTVSSDTKLKDLESLHILPPKDDDLINQDINKNILELGSDEKELVQAYDNFLNAVTSIAKMRDISLPFFLFNKDMLFPNYKPSTGKKIVADAMMCWDVLLEAFPEKLSSIKPNASDEEFLNFAESLSDQNLQLAIISYVEILIDIENCEISYEEKRLRAQRRRIERELYEEYQRRQERKQKFIHAVAEKEFPVDAERLINNYFKTALKDAEGAYDALTKNPAVYAPIENEKIKPRLFGLIKPTPKDGIRENYKLGKFLSKLRV